MKESWGETDGWKHSQYRAGASPVELKALGRIQRDLASMPASLVVQIALWPTKLSEWARERKMSSAMVYNCLAGTKPYAPVRDLLAESLGVSRLAVDHLIAAHTPPSSTTIPPDPVPPTDVAPQPDSPGETMEEGVPQMALNL